ncbi:hypothetical protein GF340_03990, partial [Candidatus Peregrinibacteria bacterium]|nr:hypothetical protein [Candidatus Peregrinibacteria bacterium]
MNNLDHNLDQNDGFETKKTKSRLTKKVGSKIAPYVFGISSMAASAMACNQPEQQKEFASVTQAFSEEGYENETLVSSLSDTNTVDEIPNYVEKIGDTWEVYYEKDVPGKARDIYRAVLDSNFNIVEGPAEVHGVNTTENDMAFIKCGSKAFYVTSSGLGAERLIMC